MPESAKKGIDPAQMLNDLGSLVADISEGATVNTRTGPKLSVSRAAIIAGNLGGTRDRMRKAREDAAKEAAEQARGIRLGNTLKQLQIDADPAKRRGQRLLNRQRRGDIKQQPLEALGKILDNQLKQGEVGQQPIETEGMRLENQLAGIELEEAQRAQQQEQAFEAGRADATANLLGIGEDNAPVPGLDPKRARDLQTAIGVLNRDDFSTIAKKLVEEEVGRALAISQKDTEMANSTMTAAEFDQAILNLEGTDAAKQNIVMQQALAVAHAVRLTGTENPHVIDQLSKGVFTSPDNLNLEADATDAVFGRTLRTKRVETAERLENARLIKDLTRPQFLGIDGWFHSRLYGGKDWLNISSDAEKDFVSSYAGWKGLVEGERNRFRKLITGAQAAFAEIEQFKDVTPDISDSETEFAAKLFAMTDFYERLDKMTLQFMAENRGMKPTDDELENMMGDASRSAYPNYLVGLGRATGQTFLPSMKEEEMPVAPPKGEPPIDGSTTEPIRTQSFEELLRALNED
jgi:hypothetical protein